MRSSRLMADGKLADYLIVPEYREGSGFLGVNRWEEPSGTIATRCGPTNGAYSVADPRHEFYKQGYGVTDWAEPGSTIAGESMPSNGKFAVADPRFEGEAFGQFGVRDWQKPAAAVTSQRAPGQGPISVADPRLKSSTDSFQNIYRIVPFDEPSKAVTGATHVAGGAACVADPRRPNAHTYGKYAVTRWADASGTVIGGDDSGAYAVADPRSHSSFQGKGKYIVTPFGKPANSVIGGSTTGSGAFVVADPRITRDRDTYRTAGEYGVVPWSEPSGAIQAQGQYDNGRWSVADPRFPEAADKLVCVIRALDNTWHRPFTTLELAALQSLVDPEEELDFDGLSDSSKRERIGNAVPPDAAKVIASVMGETLLAGITYLSPLGKES